MKTLVLFALLAVASAHVQANQQLATRSNCMTCHQMDKKALGPSFKEIAARYKGQANAQTTLTNSILQGVRGKWGRVPMAAQRVSPADAATLSRWILTL